MADISTEDLKSEIHAILKTADLNVVSAKKVREQVEKKLNCSLLNRKKEFTDIVMDFINQQQEAEEQNNKNNSGDDSAESESEEIDSDKEPPRKKNASASKSTNNSAKKRQATMKKKKFTSNGSGSDSDSDNGSDSDYEQPKAKKTKKKSAASGEGGNTTGRKSTGFTRAYTLSPELAELVGAESMPRHEVVKKVWALIKERQLYDPKNKQYAICDDDLLKVMKVKRFRAFSMLKHLKPHFID